MELDLPVCGLSLSIGVDDGGDMSPPLFEIRILSPPVLKMCKPIATEKIPTHSTEIVESKIMRKARTKTSFIR